MEKSHTTIASRERRRFFGVVAATFGSLLEWGALFRDRGKSQSEEPRGDAPKTSVTINPLAVPRNTRPTHNNG